MKLFEWCIAGCAMVALSVIVFRMCVDPGVNIFRNIIERPLYEHKWVLVGDTTRDVTGTPHPYDPKQWFYGTVVDGMNWRREIINQRESRRPVPRATELRRWLVQEWNPQFGWVNTGEVKEEWVEIEPPRKDTITLH